eukprot:2740540-Prymnesium_polylepis.1
MRRALRRGGGKLDGGSGHGCLRQRHEGWLAQRVELLTAAPARSEKGAAEAAGRATRALGKLGGHRKASQLR